MLFIKLHIPYLLMALFYVLLFDEMAEVGRIQPPRIRKFCLQQAASARERRHPQNNLKS